MYSLALIALSAFVITALMTERVRLALLRGAVLDRPNERSMHATPTPRGGGVAVVPVIIGGTAAGAAIVGNAADWWIVAGAVLLLAVSWLDDRKGAGVGVRFGAHVLAASVGTLAFSPDQLLFAGYAPLWLDRAVMVVGWAWFMNLYNFMDGIDGITGVQTIVTAAGVGLLLYVLGLGGQLDFVLAALLMGACGGFLIHNWHPAKIFLGDSGSVPLGFLTGFLLLELATRHQLVAALIISLYYLADSGITLGRRILRGEKFWKPHREHFYQRAAQAAGRHDVVVLWIFAADIVLVAAAWWVAIGR